MPALFVACVICCQRFDASVYIVCIRAGGNWSSAFVRYENVKDGDGTHVINRIHLDPDTADSSGAVISVHSGQCDANVLFIPELGSCAYVESGDLVILNAGRWWHGSPFLVRPETDDWQRFQLTFFNSAKPFEKKDNCAHDLRTPMRYVPLPFTYNTPYF